MHNSSPRQTNTVFTSRQTRPQKSNRPKKNSLKISGDRYEAQTASNPVLMATTQYSWVRLSAGASLFWLVIIHVESHKNRHFVNMQFYFITEVKHCTLFYVDHV